MNRRIRPVGKRLGIAAAANVLTVLSVCHAEPQTIERTTGVSAECVAWIKEAMADVEAGMLAKADVKFAAALAKAEDRSAPVCTGLILHNQATIASIAGRFAEGERLAVASITTLERVYPPDDLVLLRPLLVLASTRLEQGNKSGARIAFGRVKRIHVEQPHERAMIHATSGSLLQAFGERRLAEDEYLAALDAWTRSGRGETAEAGAVLTSLATLYLQDGRFEEARRSVERASALFSQASDAAPMDRSKLLCARAMLHARLGELASAERDFRQGLSLVDAQPGVSATYTLALLNGLAEALRKNHHGREARRIEARAGGLRRANQTDSVIDVSDLVVHTKPKEK
jgi:tetratricopeptide (TPR) repeat protein